MLIPESLRFAQADAVDDAGVIQGIADHRVLGAEDGLEQAAVGVEARGVEDRVLGAQERADAGLQFLVDGLGAADEADRRHAVAEVVERLVRGRDDLRMIGEAQVIIGAEVQYVLAGAVHPHVDVSLLRARNQPFRLEQSLLTQRFRLPGERGEKSFRHGIALDQERPQSISGRP